MVPAVSSDGFADYKNDKIAYTGRIGMQGPEAAELYWSGTSVKINFDGTSVKAWLQDETGDNYYNVIIDGDSLHLLRPDTTRRAYTLTYNLPEGKHTLELFKRTEYDRGKTLFYGFDLGSGTALLPPPPPKARKLEFYGNSITAGYAVEDTSGKDRPDSTYTNNYLSYAALTARHFDAAYTCICKSGIGIMISWFPTVMPDIYDRLNPSEPNSTWNFTKYTPDVVVINLLQNDSWLVNMPENAEFKRVFGSTPPQPDDIVKAYGRFVASVREKYPEAQIICMLGNMDITKAGSPWPGYVQQAVDALQDDSIYTLVVPYKNTPGHPDIREQQQLADHLIRFIDKNIVW
ncbi:electron transporter RnfD [Pontibacter sp. 172403-2]|nr:electron transporter RnfD [Pontibacter sp. 172403-2]